MKVKKKALSLILAVVMVLGTVPFTSVVANAEDTGVKMIEIGTSGVIDKSDYKDKDFVYFGNYYGTDIKWRVLDADKDNTGADNGMFLLSEYLLEQSSKPFEEVLSNDNDGQTNPNEWQHSAAQGWCTTFAENAFIGSEKAALKSVNKTDAETWQFGFLWGTSSLVCEIVFYLSAEEVANYIGTYTKAEGLATTTGGNNSGGWWLRSPHSNDDLIAGFVNDYGNVITHIVNDTYPGVRPAFNLNLDSVLFSSAVTDGKSSGTVGANALKSVSEYTSDTAKEWKFTLLDDTRTFTAKAADGAVTSVEPGYSNWSVDVTYSNAKTEAKEYVSAMLCDANDNVLYYGNIAKSSASGTQSVSIPAGLAIGNYKLKVFSEQLNGNTKTDYASAFKEISLRVTYPKVATPNASFTATSHNSGTLTGVTTDMMYSLDGGETWEAVTGTTMDILNVTSGSGVQVYAKGDERTTSDSDVQKIIVTQAAQPAGLTKTDCTTAANSDGKISGVNSTMEYKLSSESNWRAVTGTELIGLSNGTYQFRVKASGTVLASEAQSITIGAYVAPPAPSVPTAANYTDVDKAITEIPAALSLYTDASVNALNSAIAAVDRNKTQAEQTIVDGYATAIRDAIKALKYKDADYSKVDTVIGKIPADLSIYTDASVKALNDAKDAVVRGKHITEQSTVDGYATAIQKAIDGLVKKTAAAGTSNNNNNNNEKDKNATSPQTGDSNNMFLWLAVLMISAGVILTIRITQKTCKNHSDR